MKYEQKIYIPKDNDEFVIISNIKEKITFYKNNVYKKKPIIFNFLDKNLTKEELEYVYKRTSFLDNSIKLKQRLMLINNDIDGNLICENCGKIVDPNRFYYRVFDKLKPWCSLSCCEKLQEIKQKILKTLIRNTNENIEDLTNPFQLESIKQKSKETIQEKYNDSRIINISQVKLRQKGYENYLNNFYVMPLFSYEEYNEMCFNINRYHNKELKWKCKECGKEFKTNVKTKPTKPDGIHETNISCPYCYPARGASMYERQIIDFLKTIYSGKIEANNRTVLLPDVEKTWKNPHEIDIWIPDLKYAIEFNGTYHHADPRFFKENDIVKGKTLSKDVWKYDNIKIEAFKKLNIEYSIIWQHDWTEEQNKIKNNIKSKIVMLQNRV